jgi:hypothetical protein
VLCTPGATAGKCMEPQGVAVDFETGRLFVADEGNRRVDVFDSEGHFERAFGWGVKDGEAKLEVCTTSCRLGLAGTGSGQFGSLSSTSPDSPTAIAVDNDPASPSHHDVYVVDYSNLRVEKFDPSGNFLLAFGGGVDKTVPGDVCTAASGHTCGAGSEGFGEGEFFANNSSGRRGIFVGIGPGGTVYVADSRQIEPGKYEARLQKFEPSGAPIAPQHVFFEGKPPLALAVDSTGSFYASFEGQGFGAPGEKAVVRKYEADTSEVRVVAEDLGEALAVDPGDDLFVGSPEGGVGEDGRALRQSIVEYDSSGTLLRRFGYGSFQQPRFGGLAPFHSAGGDIYASERDINFNGTKGSRVIQVAFPPPGPIVLPEPCKVKAGTLGNTKATLVAEVNPEGKATEVHFEYVTQAHFEAEGFENPSETAVSSIGEGTTEENFHLGEVALQASLVPETQYRCRAVAVNADGTAEGEAGTFTSLEPLEIGGTWASEVGSEGATLNAEINPLGIPTTAYFQYVEEATYLKDIEQLGPGHGFDHAGEAPDLGAGEEPLQLGAGEQLKAIAAPVSGLSPGTAYRYRVIATDSLIAPAEVAGPTEQLRTYAAGALPGLPDGRAYELASPNLKNSAEVGVPGARSGLISFSDVERIEAAAGSGEAISYTSWTSFGEAEGAPATSQYLSKRTAGGWQTENISPFGTERVLRPPYRGFDAELGIGALVVSNPALTGDCPEGIDNLYLRSNATGALRCLTSEAPILSFSPGLGGEFCLDYAGASEDGSRAFFAADGSYAGAPTGPGYSLYESSTEGGLKLLSVLPTGKAAAPSDGTAFGPEGGRCSPAGKLLRHAVSNNGQRVFWTYAPEAAASQLLVRIGGTETVQLDKRVSGGTGLSGGGVFRGASADGSKAFFTDDSRLSGGSGATAGKPDLYRYELPAKTLTDLTSGSEPADVKGVSGLSDDGSYVYFVAAGVLSGEEENETGEKATAGEDNLYLWHEGQISFIAILSGEDSSDWSPQPLTLSARVSPDGSHLAFLSRKGEKLAGYDNTIAAGDHCQPGAEAGELKGSPLCPEAFLYDAESDTLRCASCNPSGERPTGPTLLPGWRNPFEGPRYLSNDGSRLFFESLDALLPADESEKRDVYEFELPGKGSCTGESTAFDTSSGGCHFLISSGRSEDESYLLDASSEGRDAFFSTRSALSGWDRNENYDVYDAREGGGFPEPPQELSCEGEACKPPAAAPPSTPQAATPSFQGPGNVVKRAKKHRHRRKARHHRHRHRAQRQGRAAR